jgi:hypothetical protein
LSESEKLDTLAARINEEHRAFVGTFRKSVEHAVEHGICAGELLSQAKAQCPHGTWLRWLEENFEGLARAAQAYMRLYKYRDVLRTAARTPSVSEHRLPNGREYE